MKIKARDSYSINMCVTGTRLWFKKHKTFFESRNICFKTFVKEGIDEDVLLATGDPMAKKVVESVKNGRK